MTATDYFRNLSLSELGISIDPIVIEFDQYIKERLSNLIKYKSNYDLKEIAIYYGKSSNELILVYYPELNMINLYYKTFSKKFAGKLKVVEMKKVVMYYISNILLIRNFYIHQYIQENIIPLNVEELIYTEIN